VRKAKGKAKIGIVNSIGQRRDPRAVRNLSRLVGGKNEALASAAAAALGQIGNAAATKALAGAKDKTSGKLQMVVLDSYLKCADRLAAEGEKTQAVAIYKELQKADMPKPIRTAAVAGMISAMQK